VRSFLLASAALALSFLFGGCSSEQRVSAATASVRVEPPPDQNTFQVDKPERFPLVTAELRRTRDDLSVTGVVAPDVGRTVAVNSLAAGRVLELRARLGDDVQKGQVLVRINSNDLASAFGDYQKAVSSEILARHQRDREKDLYSHDAAALKEVEAAEDAEQKAVVDLKTAAERIRILGGSVDRPSPVLDVTAPVSGTIIEQNITPAAAVKSIDSSPNLFTIADLSRVWVLCDIYENDLARVSMGDIAEVRLNAYPDRPLRARVSNISRVLDPATRTAKVRIEMANPRGLLRPGMFATARFYSRSELSRVVIPTSAVLRLHDKDWVFRRIDANRFRRVEIRSGETTSDGYQYALAGLKPGDQVVENALQFSSVVQR
jgi:cobalt-zinc-cadmium efflux system membrane fusion protein